MASDHRSEQSDVDRLLETLLYLYSESRRATKRVAREHGLTGPQMSALKLLCERESLSLSELSTRMDAKNSTITGIVDRMERDGLVRRERSASDRRVCHIEPTEQGRRLFAAVPASAIELFAQALRALSASDRAELMRILSVLARRVREQGEQDLRAEPAL